MSKVRAKGFTLIELSFSLVFISILSLAVVFVIVSTIKTYSRGIVLNKVNTVGMELVDDMRMAAQSSPKENFEGKCEKVFSSNSDTGKKNLDDCKKDSGRKFVSVARVADVEIKGRGVVVKKAPIFGAFCTGEYSYIWNSGYFMAEDSYSVADGEKAKLTYRKDGKKIVKVEDFRLLKVHDRERAVCISSVVKSGYGGSISDSFDISGDEYSVVDEEPIELLSAFHSDNNLVLYNLESGAPAEDSGGALLYVVSFILGSVQGGINISSTDNYCATLGEEAENLDFCSVNRFNFAAMATGS